MAGYLAIQLFHPQFTIKRPGRAINLPVELFMEWIAKVEPGLKPLRERHMLFTFDQFGGMAGVERWMPVAERYRELLGRVMNTIYPSSMFVQDRVLNRVASLEALHKQWSGRSAKLVDALQELPAYADAPFEHLVGSGKVTTWCQKAKDERHDIAHHLGRQPHLDMSELFYIGQ